MVTVFSIIFLISIVVIYFFFTAKGPKRFLTQLEEPIQVLLQYGKDDGFQSNSYLNVRWLDNAFLASTKI